MTKKGIRRPRRGLTVIIVLGLVSITLALSYALLRAHTTSVQVQQNLDRATKARHAAETGILAGLKAIQSATWAGVDVPLTAKTDAEASYDVQFQTGDASLAPSHPDYAEYPFRLTITSTGIAVDPNHPAVRSTHRVQAVVQLIRRQLFAPPATWAKLQAYTVYQWEDQPSVIQSPVRVDGRVHLQGALNLCVSAPASALPRTQYLSDLEKMRQAALGDARPVDGPVELPYATNSALTLMHLGMLGVATTDAPRMTAAPLTHPGGITTYRLYPGGQEYTVPLLPPVLSNAAFGPDVVTNPLAVYRSDGNLYLDNNVRIDGTLITFNVEADLHIRGTNVHFQAIDLPPLADSADRLQMPAVIVRDDVRLHSTAGGSISGYACVFDEFEFREGGPDVRFDLSGQLATGELLLRGRQNWNFDSTWWDLRLAEFNLAAAEPDTLLKDRYFPLWLESRYNLRVKPLLTVRPQTGVKYHWQNWSEPVYVPHPDDKGLVWEVIRMGSSH